MEATNATLLSEPRSDWSRVLVESSERLQRAIDISTARPVAAVQAGLRALETVLTGFGNAMAGGLYRDVIDEAPRLEGTVKRISSDGHRLQQQVSRHLADLVATAPAGLSLELRRQVVELCHRVECTASRALQVVHDAYDVDVGGH